MVLCLWALDRGLSLTPSTHANSSLRCVTCVPKVSAQLVLVGGQLSAFLEAQETFQSALGRSGVEE